MEGFIIFVASKNRFIMKQFTIVLITVFGFGLTAVGQGLAEEVQTVKAGEGKIVIHQEEGIDYLMKTMVEENARKNGVDGWQIQLYSGTGPEGKRQAMEVKTKMLEEFPDVQTITKYNPPFWRVRVGNYRNRNEALPMLKQLKSLFPNCYSVKGIVRMEDL